MLQASGGYSQIMDSVGIVTLQNFRLERHAAIKLLYGQAAYTSPFPGNGNACGFFAAFFSGILFLRLNLFSIGIYWLAGWQIQG